ncbi:MAG: DNA cytosine methyltransferase [Candidatus Poribacteria bacterium]|nr:DNA cytosine methyltransferase [Candidatus Poribacteria bacterium]
MKIPIISLFSGAGGLDLGFEQNGFQPIVAYDKKPAAVETYNHNRSDEIAREADLSWLTGDNIIREIAELELTNQPCGVVGGPPCQYFSNGNTTPRQKDDPRRALPSNYANILKRLNEAYELDFFIFENVKGLTGPAHRDDFEQLVTRFEKAGFRVFKDVLDAYEFGVPQYRKRVFLIGWNEDLYPTGTYQFPVGNVCGLTVQDAIGELDEPQFYSRNLNPDEFPEHPNHWTMRPVSEKFRNPPPRNLKPSTRSFRRLSWNKPSYTVAYGHNEIHVHPKGHRRLSIYEAMRIQGFPPGKAGYRLIGSLSEQVTLVSDAVPPPLSAALARSILAFMHDHGRHE